MAMSQQDGDKIERVSNGGIRVLLNDAPYGTFTLHPDELALLARHNLRCHRCNHLHLFHPVKGGFCVVGICTCTVELME